MKRLGVVSVAALALSALLEGHARADGAPPAPAPNRGDAGADESAPFFDAGGAKLPPPPLPKPPRPRSLIFSPALDVGELFVPSLSSGGFLIEPSIELGNEIIAGGGGYVNLAGAHGGDFELTFGRWASALRIMDSHGWLGTWLLPDLTARFMFFPGQSAPPSWILGVETRPGGLRFARCLHQDVCVELTAAAEIGAMLVQVGDVQGGVFTGGHFGVGFAFWR